MVEHPGMFFNITRAEADKLANMFKVVSSKNTSFLDLARQLEVGGSGRDGFVCFLFGTLWQHVQAQQDESVGEKVLKGYTG